MNFETKCFKVRLKPGSLERVREWASTINSRSREALATLRDESIVVESAFLESSENGDFLIYYMKARSFQQADEAAATSTHSIDEYHRQFKLDTWERREELEMLIDLDRIRELEK